MIWWDIFYAVDYCPIRILNPGLSPVLKLRYLYTCHSRRIKGVWSIWFFFLAGIGGGFYIIKCIKVCVKDNWYSFFLYFPMHIICFFFLNPINFKYHLFKNLFLSPPQKNHITGMQYSYSSINDDTFVLFI